MDSSRSFLQSLTFHDWERAKEYLQHDCKSIRQATDPGFFFYQRMEGTNQIFWGLCCAAMDMFRSVELFLQQHVSTNTYIS